MLSSASHCSKSAFEFVIHINLCAVFYLLSGLLIRPPLEMQRRYVCVCVCVCLCVCVCVCVSVVACCLYKYTLQCLSIKLEAFLLHSVSQMLHAFRIATKQSVDAPWEGV